MAMNFWVSDEHRSENSTAKSYEFLKKETKKYLLTIHSTLNIGGIISENTVEVRWMLTLKNIYPESYEFELITIDNTIIKTNNNGFKEIHKLVTQMQKALNELSFTTNKKCKVIEVINLKVIKEKWQSVKAEMVEYNNNMTTLQEVFSIQEKNFETKGGVEKMVNDTEFFEIYFNSIYGTKLPFKIKKSIPNIYRTCNIPFSINYTDQKIDEQFRDIHISGVPLDINTDFIKNAYGKFPFIEIEKVQPQYNYVGYYRINLQDGFLEHGTLTLEEKITEKLNAKITYKFTYYG